MAGDTYTLQVLAEVKRYATEMAKIPGITDKQVGAAALRFQTQWARAQQNAAKAAQRAGEAAGKGWESTAKRLAGAGEASEKLGGALGLVSPGAQGAVAAVGKLGKAASLFANPAGLAVAAVGALAVGAGALTSSLVASVFAADDALKSLEGFKRIGSEFYPDVPAATLQSIKDANASLDALGSVWDKLVVEVGATVAPALVTVTNTMVGLALTTEEALTGSGLLAQGLGALAQIAGGVFTSAVQTALVPLEALAWAAEALATVTGRELPEGAQAAITKLHEIREAADSAALGDYSGVLGELRDTFGDLEGKGAAFVHTQERATAAMGKGKKAADEMSKSYRDMLAAMDADTKAQQDAEASLKSLQDAATAAASANLTGIAAVQAARDAAQAKLLADYQAAIQAGADAAAANEAFETARGALVVKFAEEETAIRKAEAEKQLANRKAVLAQEYDLAMQGLSLLQGGLADLAENNDRLSRKGARAAFRASQAVGVAQATIAAYKAAAEAFAVSASLGPVGLAAAPFVAASTFALAEAAAVIPITEQQLSFHRGGFAPDERTATVRKGEATLTPSAVANLGRQRVNQLNDGRGGGSGGGALSVTLSVTSRVSQEVAVQGGINRRGGAYQGAQVGQRSSTSRTT